ncbi:MAG: hypothetical protein IJ829_05865, partial [Kiritimatiellae bacterium]|nr:hypothetical protein [Kiritimatiellia bacterium]
MKTTTLTGLALAAFAAPLALRALDLSDKADLRFAEDYAFSTNRAALIATLRPESKAWFVYSILNAETEGRFKDAHKLFSDWTRFSHVPDQYDSRAYEALYDRVTLREWTDASLRDAPAAYRMRDILRRHCGLDLGPRERETPLAPNTYPARLDPKQVSFEAFWSMSPHFRSLNLKERFSFLPMIGEKACADEETRSPLLPKGFLYDAPGCGDYLLRIVDKDAATVPPEAIKGMPLPALAAVAEKLKGAKRDLRAEEFYARTVLEKLAPGADDDPNDYAAALDLARRRLAFVDTLLPALAHIRRDEYRAYLELCAAHGDWAAARGPFAVYLDLLSGENERRRGGKGVEPKDLVGDYLVACRFAGLDVSPFKDKIEERAFRRLMAEADLLAGRPAADADALSAEAFKRLQERVELNWAKSNPAVFAADADVSLALEVKNVRKMRLAVYVLDAFAACRVLGGEAAADVDLDAAVPTFSRTFDYSAVPAVVRHVETLALPELKTPGLYVVECAGEGVSSRALVRKGRLRVTERRTAHDHVFTALDETGAVVKGARLRLGETV